MKFKLSLDFLVSCNIDQPAGIAISGSLGRPVLSELVELLSLKQVNQSIFNNVILRFFNLQRVIVTVKVLSVHSAPAQDSVNVDVVLMAEDVINVESDFLDFLIAKSVTVMSMESNLLKDYYLVVILPLR